MEDLILLDTTELLRVMPRKLHAAWAELSGTKTRMSPAVAGELAPAGVLQSRTTALSVAEDLLRPDAPALDDDRRQQLERQAWWAAMWRDPVERTRRRFPRPTIATDRAHPSCPHAA